MHKTVVLNVVGLTPSMLGEAMPRADARGRARDRGADQVGLPGRHLLGAVGLPHRPATRKPTASSATAGTRARMPRSGSGSSRTGWCRGRRSGTRRAPRIRRSRARTCSGGSTCTRRRTIRSRRGRCIRPTAGRSRTSTPRPSVAARRASGSARNVSALRVLGTARRRSDRRRWIADAARHVDRKFNPTLTLVYLPHLDYNLQRVGPGTRGRARTSRRWTPSAAT